MQLLLSLCLIWALLPTAELLRCHECNNADCSNTTSVDCPATSTACRTITSLTLSSSSFTARVNKTCSTVLTCITPLTIETEWSVNRGFRREAHTQICCATDNCNFPTLAVPNPFPNGKECPSCASSADSLAGTCNSTLSCMGVEDSCFNGTSTSNSDKMLELGCISRNFCNNLLLQVEFGANSQVVCRAPWSVKLSAMLLTFALTACKVLV